MQSSSRQHQFLPAPSDSMIALQRRGFELTQPKSSPTPSEIVLQRSTSSPPRRVGTPSVDATEYLKKRSSSVYSDDTTITNILQLYGHDGDIDGESLSPPVLHHPEAYRDVVAPLLIRRLSGASSNSKMLSELGDLLEGQNRDMDQWSIQSERFETAILSPATAPSFTEFTRDLEYRHQDLATRASASSKQRHLQDAWDRLGSTGSSALSRGSSIMYDNNSFRQNDTVGLRPDVSRYTTGGIQSTTPLCASQDDLQLRWTDMNLQQKEWKTSWSTDSFVMYETLGELMRTKLKEKLNWKKWSERKDHHGEQVTPDKEAGRQMSSMQRQVVPNRQGSLTTFGRKSSLGGLVRALSLSGRRHSETNEHPDSRRRQKQLAIPPTPYQLYGPEIWTLKAKKQRQKEREARMKEREAQLRSATEPHSSTHDTLTGEVEHARHTSRDIHAAFHHGQAQLVSALGTAQKKLTERATDKRRQRLKNSIVMVGPTILGSTEEPLTPQAGWV